MAGEADGARGPLAAGLVRENTGVAAIRRSHLNDFFRWAIRWELIEKNPLDRLEQPPHRKKKAYDVFSDAEVAALTGLPAIDGTLMLMMFDAGLRRSECLALQPPSILPEPLPGQLRIVAGKGGKDRLIPLTRRLSQALAGLQLLEGMSAREFFWYTKPAGRKVRRTVKAGEAPFHIWWVRCLEQADVRYRNPHMSRHTFATRWLRKSGRLETLSLAMGHESIRTTFDLYGHLNMSDVAADLELIEQ